MSGPKISIYELSERQKKNLLAQLKCTQDSFVCVEQTKQLINGQNGLGDKINTLLDTLSLVNARKGNYGDSLDELLGIHNYLVQDCASFMDELNANMPVVEDKITVNENELNKKKALLAKLKSIQSKVDSYLKKVEQTLSEINDKAKAGIKESKNKIADDIAAVSSFYIEPESNEIEKYDDMVSRRKQRNSLEELKSRYVALCAVAQTQPKTFSADESGVGALALEISALEKQILKQGEQAYISDCVNDVMAEMGYDIIGNRSVTKRSGKRFRNELFSYGDGTAINVTYDSEGQIAMELGGIDKIDRTPTSDETDALCEDMESFCADFRTFEKKMEAKGISVMSRISMSPPAAEYAAIINVDDYNITTTKPISGIAIGKRKKSSAKNKIRKENN